MDSARLDKVPDGESVLVHVWAEDWCLCSRGDCLGYLPTERYKGLCFQLDGPNKQITLQPTWLTTGVSGLYVPVDGQGGTYAGNQPVFTAFYGNFAGNGGVANLDGSFNLQGGEKPEGTLQTVLRWQSAAAINPPSTQTPK